MDSPQASTSEFAIDPYVRNVLDGVGLYAKEHGLSADQVWRTFNAGLAVRAVLEPELAPHDEPPIT